MCLQGALLADFLYRVPSIGVPQLVGRCSRGARNRSLTPERLLLV
jgi:hypothetical protein